MNRFLSGKRARALPGLVLAGGLALAGAGCDTNKLVEVQDPGALRPSDLNNLGSVPALVAGAFRQFVAGYSGLGGDAFLSSVAVLTDEMYYGDTFTTREAADKRTLQPSVLGNISDGAYSALHQARFNARRFSRKARPSIRRRLTRWSLRALSPMPRPSRRAVGPVRSSRPGHCAWAPPKRRIFSRCSMRRTARSAVSTQVWRSSLPTTS